MACQADITVFSAHSLLPSTVGTGLGALCALLLGHFSLVPPLSISAVLEQMLLKECRRLGVEEMPRQQEPETLSKLCGILWL